MYKEIWEMLEIEPTTQISVIKSAYAAKAKKYHPEEYPEEFQRLQKAYKSAMQYAKQSAQLKVEPEVHQEKANCEEPEVQQIMESCKEPEVQQESEATDVKSEISFESEAAAEQDMNFDFGEIEEDSAEDIFIKELGYIAMNPYLVNDLLAWKVFLGYERNQRLLKDSSVRSRMVKKLSGISGFRRKTVVYLNKYLEKYENDSADTKKPFLWRIKGYSILSLRIFSPQNFVMSQPKELHDIFIHSVKKKTGEASLKNENAMSCYIGLYLEYASHHSYSLYNSYTRSNISRTTLLIMIVTFIVMAIWVQMISSDLKEKKQQEKINEYNQKRIEEIRKYNE